MENDLPDHWVTGCSNAKRWVNCPGSKYAKDDRPAGRAAKTGTLGHKIVESLLDESEFELDSTDREIIDTLEPEAAKWFTESIMMCFDYVDKLRKTEGATLLLETKIKSNRIPDHGGTVDVIFYCPESKTLQVVDFKFGSTPVDAEGNYQLAAYLNLARQRFPDAEKFIGSIIQPTYRGVDTVEFMKDWLDNWLVEAAVSADPDNMKLKADASWCEYCPLLSQCKEAAKLCRSAANEFEPIKEKENLTPEEVETLEKLLMVFKLSAKAAAECSQKVKEAHDSGLPLTYHKVTSTSTRVWKPEAESSPDLESFKELVLSSPAKVQKKLKMTKKQFDEDYRQMLDYKTSSVLRVGTKPDASEFAEFETP